MFKCFEISKTSNFLNGILQKLIRNSPLCYSENNQHI